MTDYIWPASLIPAQSTITLRDLSSRFGSPFTGTARTYSRPGGDLLSLSLALPPMRAAQSAALRSLVARLRGGVHRVWCKDHAYVRRGSFPAAEMLANNTFAAGTAGWVTVNATITAADGVLRFVGTSGASSELYRTATSAFDGTSQYALRSFFLQGPGTFTDWGNFLSSTNYVDQYGLVTAVGSPTAGSATAYPLVITSTNTYAAGSYMDLAWCSLSRCALIAGGSQTGAQLVIDALPASTNGLLLEGDQVQIGTELFIVTAALNSNSSGEGYLTLHRPPRTVPADNAPVIIHEPMGRFMLAESDNGWDNIPGKISNATVSLLEAP